MFGVFSGRWPLHRDGDQLDGPQRASGCIFMPAEAHEVRQLFDEVAPHYDRLNDLLSWGCTGSGSVKLCSAGSRCRRAVAGSPVARATGPGASGIAVSRGVLAVDAAAAPAAGPPAPWAMPLAAGGVAAGRCHGGAQGCRGFDGAVMAYGLAIFLIQRRVCGNSGVCCTAMAAPQCWISTAAVATAACKPWPCAVWWCRWPASWSQGAIRLSGNRIAEFPTGVEQEQMAISAGFSWAAPPHCRCLMGLLELRC